MRFGEIVRNYRWESLTYLQRLSERQLRDAPVVLKEDVGDVKQKIVDLVKNLRDVDELKTLYMFIKRKSIRQSIEQALAGKDLGDEIISSLTQLIIKTKVGPEDIDQFIEQIKGQGFIDKTKFSGASWGSIDDLVIHPDNDVYHKIKGPLMSYKPAKTTAVGAGEVFFVVLGNEVYMSDVGDISVDGRAIEIKATTQSSGARMRGQSGFAPPASVWPAFAEKLQEIYPEADLEKPQNYAFTVSGIKNLNEILAQNSNKKTTQNLLYTVINGLFFKLDSSKINKFTSQVVNSDGTINSDAFRIMFSALNYDYYRSTEGFEGILVLNTQKNTYAYAEDANDFITLLEEKRIVPMPSFNWNGGDSRDGIYMIKAGS
jgi:hypothetical protein